MGVVKIGLGLGFLLVSYTYLQSALTGKLPVVVDGYFHPDFKPLADAFRENVRTGKERGGAFTVYHEGECVLDMWGGYADVEAERPWSKDAMTMGFSATKGVAAIVVASLVEKGLVDYKRPVAEYWPEFKQKEKGNITVEMLLGHQAGLVRLDEKFNLRELKTDPGKVERILAAQETMWPAGTQFGYHVITYGLYVDMLVQKVDPNGRSMQQIFLEDIARPFGLDMYMNTPRAEIYRTARLYTSPRWKTLMEVVTSRTYFPFLGYIILFPGSKFADIFSSVREFMMDTMVFNNPDIREVTLSAASGTGTARGFAKLYGILANGGTDGGNQLLSADAIAQIATPQMSGRDAVLQIQTSLSRGTIIRDNPKGQQTFGHSGHGGQVAFADPKNKLGFAYLTNFISIYGLADDPRFLSLEGVMYKCLEQHVKSR